MINLYIEVIKFLQNNNSQVLNWSVYCRLPDTAKSFTDDRAPAYQVDRWGGIFVELLVHIDKGLLIKVKCHCTTHLPNQRNYNKFVLKVSGVKSLWEWSVVSSS